MTSFYLAAKSSVDLGSVKREVEGALDAGLLEPDEATRILQSLELTGYLIRKACEVERASAPKGDEPPLSARPNAPEERRPLDPAKTHVLTNRIHHFRSMDR